MNNLIVRYFLIAFVGFITTGCANWTAINKTKFSTGAASAHFVDAKQRALISQRWAKYPHTNADGEPNGDGYWYYRFCSEPPPDAFSVIGFALAGDLEGQLLPDGESAEQKQLKASIAQSLSEAGSTIERTQTVNLLRESMFRTCERYLNGALSNTEFVIQAARDQRAMVAVLSIEQLTGIVRPQPTILVSGSASSTPITDPTSLVEELSKAKKDAEAARALADKEKATFDGLSTKPKCQSEPIEESISEPSPAAASSETESDVNSAEQPETTEPDVQSGNDTLAAGPDESEPSESACVKEIDLATQETKAKKAESTARASEEYYATVLALSKEANVTDISSTSVASGLQGSSVSANVGQTHNKVVADTVLKIVEAAFDDGSELTFICMAHLRNSSPPTAERPDPLYDNCASLIGQQIQNEITNLSYQASSSKEDAAIDKLQRFVRPDGVTINQKNRASLVDWMQVNGLSTDPGFVTVFLWTEDYLPLRQKAVRELGL